MYQGLFWQQEDIDAGFLAARYANGTGNLYKLSLSVFLKVACCGAGAAGAHLTAAFACC